MNVLSSYQEEIIEENKAKRPIKKIISDIITIFLLILCLFLVFTKYFWFFCVEVDGTSMNATLEHGDLLLVDKLATPKRGDVIVFTLNGKSYIKRIVATEGDVVLIRGDGTLHIKKAGNKSFEKVEYKGVIGKTYYNGPDNLFECVVSEGCIFVLGDNRENSTDSRALNEIDLELVDGVVHQFIIDNKDETLGKFYKYL